MQKRRGHRGLNLKPGYKRVIAYRFLVGIPTPMLNFPKILLRRWVCRISFLTPRLLMDVVYLAYRNVWPAG